MKILITTFFVSSVAALAVTASGERPTRAPRVVDLKSPDGTILKARRSTLALVKILKQLGENKS